MATVLQALASYVQNMLMDMAKEEVLMLLGVSKEIEKMHINLRDLENVLADADRRNISDRSVQGWVQDLRGAMYDATIILDLCQLRAMEPGSQLHEGCFNSLLFCMRNPLHAHDIGSRIKNLNDLLEDIKRRKSIFGFIEHSPYEEHSRRVSSFRRSIRETSSEVDESSLVGDNIEDTKSLVEMLTTKEETPNLGSNKIKVFAIVGVGGIGKTTLAQMIFNDEIVQQEFSKKIWLSVNQGLSDTELLERAIIGAQGKNKYIGNTRGALEQELKEILKGHKIFLVMDDVWDHHAWEDVLRIPMVNASLAHGSRVLVTTRHDSVARGMMAEKPYHHVNKLEPDDAWSLLKKQVFGNEHDDAQIAQVKDIGMEIIEKCDGLPLAVKVMGGLLRQKMATRRDWQNILVHDSKWSVSQMPEKLNYAIYLSYEYLHPCLKSCFLHFSLIPDNQSFYSHEIIGMWISEGFVHGTSRDLEEIGREYYDELIQRNLIVPDESFHDQLVCNMHDVVRSFAQYVARNEALVAHNSEVDSTKKLKSQKFIRLSLVGTREPESSELEWCLIQAQTSLRTLISVGHIKIKTGDSLLAFSNLRTLHVEHANFDALAESLDQLKHLRYLSLAGTNTSRLPESIGKMKFLQYISLDSCKSMVKLPTSISKLQQLRYLNLGGASIKSTPRGFDGLTTLRTLYGCPAHMDGDWCTLKELGPLSHLTRLSIGGLENVSTSQYAIKARLREKVCLRYLELNCTSRLGDNGLFLKGGDDISEQEQQQIEEVFDELCPPLDLETLVIDGYFGRRHPRWMTSAGVVSLGSLRTLQLSDMACCSELPVGLCLLPCLEFLQVVHAPAIKRVGSEFLQTNYQRQNHSQQLGVLFPKLQMLVFDRLLEWQEWEWEERVKAMPVLEELRLSSSKLRRLPPGFALHARALKKVLIKDVKHLRSLENFTCVVDLEVFGCTDMERIRNLSKLRNLTIINCPMMKVLEGMPALQRLIMEDYDMDALPRYLRDVNPRHLLVYCILSLLTCIAARKSSPEWDKFSHIQHVKVYAEYKGISRKRYVLYTREPFCFKTNVRPSAIARARKARTRFPYSKTCTVEDEWVAGRLVSCGDKLQPLCARFRCNAYRHLSQWLCQACRHCNEANKIASLSDQWTEGVEYPARTEIIRTRYRSQQQPNGTSRA